MQRVGDKGRCTSVRKKGSRTGSKPQRRHAGNQRIRRCQETTMMATDTDPFSLADQPAFGKKVNGPLPATLQCTGPPMRIKVSTNDSATLSADIKIRSSASCNEKQRRQCSSILRETANRPRCPSGHSVAIKCARHISVRSLPLSYVISTTTCLQTHYKSPPSSK